MQSLESIIGKIRDYFSKNTAVLVVDLFGSYAKGTATNKSDVDLAILCDYSNLPSSIELIEWQEELGSLLHKDVDLICLNTASPILGMQVAQNRKNILLKDPLFYDKYIIYLYSSYAELKEMRLPMEKNILKRRYCDES